jgi:transcriptional regulator with PAS, ATPase and Fis domain
VAGKELIAQPSISRARRQKPFVAINSAAIPDI